MWKSVGLVLKALVESRLAKQIAGVVVVALLEELGPQKLKGKPPKSPHRR